MMRLVNKAETVIESCRTMAQLKTAERYAALAMGAIPLDYDYRTQSVRIITNALIRKHRELKK